ncbi:polyketide synthase [Penicillium argentinense]|uniref:Polyketide synthase n=1 Tax=Penicillium argentinense TaxID=1131581 RepID=A0A9W9FHC6_9EURO|nr:polyketide synthase [Penicillium argentinense]KAJ5099997.1 polyketide synthase [Penicillium argentinense]
MQPHFANFYSWMNATVQRAPSGKLYAGSAKWVSALDSGRKRHISQISQHGVAGEICHRLGIQLVSILRGQTTPGEILSKDDILSRFYGETPKVKRIGLQFSGILRHLTHKNPRARILEIGAGSMTTFALEALGTTDSGGPHASSYHYTDISRASLETARETFFSWGDLLSFDELDIDRDLPAQGFADCTYDIVIASRMARNTKFLPRSLGKIRRLLKPSGTLLLMEDVKGQVDVEFVHGLLSDRWSPEVHDGQETTKADKSLWNHHLKSAGFTGADLELPDCDSGAWTSLTIMSSVPKHYSSQKIPVDKFIIVTGQKGGRPPAAWLKCLQNSVSNFTENLERNELVVQNLESVAANPEVYADKIAIFFGEVDDPILYDLDSASLEGIRTMSTSCQGLLWVTRGGAVDCERPELSLAPGFIRSLRNEYVGRKLLTIDLDPKGPQWSEAGASAIAQVRCDAFGNIGNDQIAERGPVEPLSLKPDYLASGDDEFALANSGALSPSSIELKPRAFGASLRNGEHSLASLECAGIITQVGGDAASRGFAVGDHVLCVSNEMILQEAASIPVAFLTAYFSLVEMARLQSSQSVLIHEAAGDVGQEAIMIAQHLGAEIFATVDGPSERGLVMLKYGIPADHIFSCGNTSFGPATRSATNGCGVDVVLNSLPGQLLHESINLVAPLGHFIETGRRDSEENSHLEMRPFSHGISFAAVDNPSLLEHRRPQVHRCLSEVMRLIETKAMTPVHPIDMHSLGEIANTSRLLQSERYLGKAVFSWWPRTVRGALAAAFANELREAGCHRVLPISCDVANEDDLARAINACAHQGLPTIRGVIHAAFVLRDAFVEKMKLDDWKTTIQSKVAGAWNLHNQFNLPGDVDFFVLFSSINGILGYASQSAYSAAGACDDALAHWRVKQCGLPAVSIDLSVVNAVGYVAEASSSETLRRSLLKAGRRVIDEDHVLSSLESAIMTPYDPQFIVGDINSGPGSHWDVDGDLSRDMRVLPLKYRPTVSTGQEQEQNGSESLASQIAACVSRDEATRVEGTAIAEMLADMFLVPVEDVDLSQSPSQQGVDSLVAVEVRNMLFSHAPAEVSIFNIMQSPSLSLLAADVVDRSPHAKFAVT